MTAGLPLLVDAGRKNLSSVVEWGRRKMLDGDYERAVKDFTTALDLKPGLIHALISRGFCHLTLGDDERARKDFAEVIAKDAGFNRNVYVLIALCFKRSGDLPTAIRYLSRCLAQFPAFRPALVARGELQLKIREYEKARVDFKHALATAPGHLVARRGLGDACRGLGSLREARHCYNLAIEGALRALGSEMRSGTVHHSQDASGDDNCSSSSSKVASVLDAGMEDAEQPLQDRAQLEAFLVEVLARRALLARLAGDLDAAGTDLLEVLQIDPRDGFALILYAKVLMEQQRHREASDYFLASIQHYERTRPQAHAILGALLMVQPNPDCQSALHHLREAMQLAPSAQPIKATYFICAAMAALRGFPSEPTRALQCLDKAWNSLRLANADETDGSLLSARHSARGSPYVAGRGGVAAAALAARSPEEATWSVSRAVERRRQELAQSDDLEKALQCTHFLQLVARDPNQQVAPVPALLHSLRAVSHMLLSCWDEAVADCRRALQINPQDEASQYNMHLAGGLSKLATPEEAVMKFTRAIRLRFASGEARVHRAVALVAAARNGRGKELLSDALTDLDAAEQQAEIAGTKVPQGTRLLRAACLCGLDRLEEGWELLQNEPRSGLTAQVLVAMGRHQEAIEVCSMLLETGDDEARANAFLLRGRCWSDLGDSESAFRDFREALVLCPHRADVHAVAGELFLSHGCAEESITAFNTAGKLAGSLSPKLAYQRALASLAVGDLPSSVKDFGRACKPCNPLARRARDGVLALQMVTDGNFRSAHVRLNTMLHVSVEQDDPDIFLRHELLLYRGVCALYVGDTNSAAMDFEAARGAIQDETRTSRHCPEVALDTERERFECEVLYNVALCHLLAKDYRSALDATELLLRHTETLEALGQASQSLACFLVGVCKLAVGDSPDEVVREAFVRSYEKDRSLVDDFLRRHEPEFGRLVGGTSALVPQLVPADQAQRVFRPIGGAPRLGREHSEAPSAVCCLRKGKPGLSTRLPPCRLAVRDVVIWARPAVAWPFTKPPSLASPVVNLAWLDICQHHEASANPALPWEFDVV